MRNKKALIVNIVYIILGICLIVLTNIGVIPDEDSLLIFMEKNKVL